MKFPTELLQKCWFLAGPTAVGKSAAGLLLAERIHAEIISLDSMAVYREMDIGTAKPSREEQCIVPHHLIDVVEPSDDFSTSHYLQLALETALEIDRRGKVPLFVGGTGLYLRAILRGLFQGPAADWEYRKQLETEAANRPPNWLHEELSKVDPETAATLHANDARRLIRALEIHHLTGLPASQQRQSKPLPPEVRPQHVYWLVPDRDWLYERINRRVREMFDEGLVQETEHLLQRQPALSFTARQALGYREVIDWLERRIETREQAIELIQTRTRQFAKRQHTWFRNLEECHPIPRDTEFSSETLVNQLLLHANS